MDPEKFLQLIRNNQGIIYKLVGLYAQSAEDKKDLYQEIMYQAWKGMPTFKGEAKFSTWLYRLCLNTILTYQRKQGRLVYKESLEAVSPAVPHASVQAAEHERLYWAIRQLQETDRAIISMHLDGFENPEIADIMGISTNHINVKLHRIKQKLAELLKDN